MRYRASIYYFYNFDAHCEKRFISLWKIPLSVILVNLNSHATGCMSRDRVIDFTLQCTHSFIGNSMFHLSLELQTKFWKMSLKVA